MSTANPPSPAELAARHAQLRRLLMQGQDREALALARELTQAAPRSGEAWKLLGVAAQRESQFALALQAKAQAAHLLPRDAVARMNLANAQRGAGDLGAAEQELRQAIALQPLFAEAHNLLALVLQQLGRATEAQQHFEQALAANPGFVQAHSNLLFMLTHEAHLSPAALLDAHRQFEARHAAALRAGWQPAQVQPEPGRRLRVGFVSGDLRQHAVAYFIAPIWRAWNHADMELVVFNNHHRHDATTRELRALCDEWHDIWKLDDAALAERIRAERVDVLVDLSGHTAHHRLLAFARKPAPVQVTAIGYPHTTGLQAMDYRLTDRHRTPAALAAQYVEKLVWIPCAAAFEHGPAPEVQPLPHLQGAPFTFGSFQRPSKISRQTVKLWARVLQALPQARLLLGAVPEGPVRERLLDEFEAAGVARTRLLCQPVRPMAEYLALHHQVDLLLDTQPYPAGTTAHHGLWMGVPTLTRTGDSVVSWQCAGVLGRMGLNAFIAHDDATFVALAVHWSQQVEALQALRMSLRQRMQNNPLMSPRTVAAGMQAALREMWRRWCAGLPAESFEVHLEH